MLLSWLANAGTIMAMAMAVGRREKGKIKANQRERVRRARREASKPANERVAFPPPFF
jgi:hypothetical protein